MACGFSRKIAIIEPLWGRNRAPSILNPRILYSGCPGNRTMAINGCVISGLDPGAVPGASTKCPSHHPRLWGGHLWGRNRIDRRVKAVPFARYGIRRYRAVCIGANDNEMALAA